MQTVQFKVLNTDTQETNVQMQTENKAQNTQNTEVSGVESTGESAGTKKRRPFPQDRPELRMRKVPDGLPVCS